MKTTTPKDLLLTRIKLLEIQQTEELQQLKLQFHSTLERLNPLYFLKKALWSTTDTPKTPSDLLHDAVNITSHLISQNALLGVFQKPIKKILGNVVMAILQKISPKKNYSNKPGTHVTFTKSVGK